MRVGLVLGLAALWLGPAAAAGPFGEELLQQMRWREVGPANPGGRITDIAVVESRPQHFLVAAATGGVWKTVNNGTTWTPIFDRYGTSSVGDIAVCQANPDIIWVGTGEANARNSVTPGDGVYKSVDGGKNFECTGLRNARHVGRVVIHPDDPDTVLVAALGCVYAPSKERGIFKTTDGGKTWRCVKFIDEDTGFVDLAMHPTNASIVYAGSYSVRRNAFSGSGSPSRHAPAGGVFKSTDGGETWTRLTAGLPAGGAGRIGLDICRKDPRIVMAVIETRQSTAADRTPTPGGPYLGINAEEQDAGVVLTQVVKDGPGEKAGLQVGDVVREFGGKKIESYQEFITEIRTRKPGDKVAIKLLRGDEEVSLEVTIGTRPEDESSQISFQDDADRGGVYRSEDGGETWKHVSATNPRPFYFSQIRIDPADDKRVYLLGVNLHVSDDGGRRFRGDGARNVHSDHHAMWIDPRDGDRAILGTDGGVYVTYDRGRAWEHLSNLALGQCYAVGLDMARPYAIYSGLQDNGTWGGPSRTRNGSIANDDWSMVNGGDGFYARVDPADPNTVYCESQYGVVVRLDRKTGARKSIRPRERGLVWEWNTPIELSPLDPKRVYVGANVLFESPDRGDTMKAISGSLCRTKEGSITTIGPSPVDPKVIWAGTNDGAVQVTRDGGKAWTDVAAQVPGLPPLLWVTRVEASRASAGAAYLTVEGRRKDDLRTYVWKTEDYGRTWASLAETLPPGEPAYVVRQHPRRHRLLFLGTERTAYVSIDDGRKWVSLQRNLPVVPVHDLAIHPRDGELVAATHGRSLWVMDIRPLEGLTEEVLGSTAHLFEPASATRWLPGKSGWFGGAKGFRGQNPQSGAAIWYYLAEDATASVSVLDGAGKTVAKLNAPGKAGLQRVVWNMRRGRSQVEAGEYQVVLSAGGMSQLQPLRVERDPEE